ncbi:ATP-dependent RNA helicase DDX25-like isoform X3 [Numida meleagris]|uniref:ATP-dependent RNA helicase DDX25-like isoform X3 n=1 Tax=Numida meleagris TaxID=8996 RepID=UPI000B3DB3A1|nr:ATP-dependent RNA helicase DDX25-like isoform X3 [Numida meleagris]
MAAAASGGRGPQRPRAPRRSPSPGGYPRSKPLGRDSFTSRRREGSVSPGLRRELPGHRREPSRFREDEESDEEEREDLAESSLLNKLLHTSLVENSQQVEVLQQDPSSPLFSIRTFEELHLTPRVVLFHRKKELLQGVYTMGFNRPSKIQENALPIMMAHPPQNLIAQSQSGTGKTAAFVLAMLSRVKGAERYPQCLCLAPTYELALQIGHVVEKMGQFCNDIKVTYAVQGNRVSPGTVLEEQVVIGTPGTMLDWCFKRRLLNMRRICMFVLDEADIMIDTQGFSSQSIRIQRALPKDCQMLLFSATFKETVWKFALQIVSRPIIIKLRQEELTLTNIRQYYFVCRNWEQKYEALCNLYGSITIGQAMIFCQTRRSADWLSVKMIQDGHQVAMLTAELSIVQRADVIQRFRDGKEKVLITTNVCARGIDVTQVTIVVNFSLPINCQKQPDFETYLHRIGRTGRFGKKGIAFNMVDSHSTHLVHCIEEHFQTEIKRLDPACMDELEELEN